MRIPTRYTAIAVLGLGITLAFSASGVVRAAPPRISAPQGIHKIQHVIVIMQENRSFDSYFGTYPGADGIPSGVCVPDPVNGGCVKPYVDHSDSNVGGPHADPGFQADVDGGKMDGFVSQAELTCTSSPCSTDVMGYHVQSDIPNYWTYAKNFVLDDHMFEASRSYSLPSHLDIVSAWSANCTNSADPMSCTGTNSPAVPTSADPTPWGWTDLTWLLHKDGVSWGYYLDHGAATGFGQKGVPPIWNVLAGFTDVQADNQEGNIRPLTTFFSQAQAGTLPAVSWVMPDPQDSEHPPALVSTGQAYVTNIINAVMNSSDWNSSAIFLAWDDWGGLYDHVNPLPYSPDSLGYGMRIPAMVISPYARKGLIDSQVLSTDAYLKFIESDFLGMARLNPATDGRPDSRPDVRENYSQLGNLVKDFNFNQQPLPPLILDPCPANTTLVPTPRPGCNGKVKLHVKTWGDS
jgi:phospholipase C